MQSLHRAAQVAVDAHSQMREAHAAYRAAYELARRHRDEFVPLRARIVEENLLRYNGMRVSVFDLLVDAREQAAAVAASIEALRDFWLADAELQAALNGPTAVAHDYASHEAAR
jgi:outer membrane protein TolC